MGAGFPSFHSTTLGSQFQIYMWKAKGVPNPTFWQNVLQRCFYGTDNRNQASPVLISVKKIQVHSAFSVSQFSSLLSVSIHCCCLQFLQSKNFYLTCRIFNIFCSMWNLGEQMIKKGKTKPPPPPKSPPSKHSIFLRSVWNLSTWNMLCF